MTATLAPPAPDLQPAAPAGPPALRVHDLCVDFHGPRGATRVLDQVSFDIAPGRILGVVGESGAGKSMTGNAVIGLLPRPGRLAGGSVELHGRRIDALRGEDLRRLRGRHIGMVFQDPLTSLNPVLSIGRHLTETLQLHLRLPRQVARERAIEWLAAVEIPDPAARLGHYPHQFSGGMRQRVAIALALCAEPGLLIADEPTTALDVSVQAQVMRLLQRLCRERGTAVLLVTHDMGVVAQAADDVLVLRHGRVVESGPVRQVLAHPREAYTRTLIAAIPPLHRRLPRLPVPGLEADAVPEPPPAAPTPTTGAPLLQLQGVSREFRLPATSLAGLLLRRARPTVLAVQDLSLQVTRGSSFGLVGESGSGKSTVARMVTGLTRPSAGRILFDGVDRWGGTLAAAALRRRFQMIFQDPAASLNPRWRVQRLVAEPLQVLGLCRSPGEVAARVAEALAAVRLPADAARRYPHEFSGGQRQRIAIARALVSRPEFIVCDEPTSSLDVSVQAQVLNLMRDLQDAHGLTYLIISHNLAVIRQMCDQVGVMQRGRLVECGPTDQVFADPQHPYTRELLAAVPQVDVRLEATAPS